MAIQNPKVGDKIWILDGSEYRPRPEELIVALHPGGELFWNGRYHGKDKRGYGHSIFTESAFPSLDELLADLRARAVPITE